MKTDSDITRNNFFSSTCKGEQNGNGDMVSEINFFPMPDAAHVQAAVFFFGYAPEQEKPELAKTILEKAKMYGISINSSQIVEWAKRNDAAV